MARNLYFLESLKTTDIGEAISVIWGGQTFRINMDSLSVSIS